MQDGTVLPRIFLAFALSFAFGCGWLRAEPPVMPRLSAGMHESTLDEGGLSRRFMFYVPRTLRASAPIVMLLHGSKQTVALVRRGTGYAFDRLADQHGFVAVYPDAYEERWNDCRARGHFAARELKLDDVGFLMRLADTVGAQAGADPKRLFLAGYSNGAQLAFRASLERPDRVAAIAAFSANLPTDKNWACGPMHTPVSALLVNGTDDRINPYDGGRVDIFGFASRGRVRSAFDSARYFASLAGLADPRSRVYGSDEDLRIDEFRWQNGGPHEVMLLGVHGGGHVVPGPLVAFPRILGDVNQAVDGPGEAWRFFERKLQRLSQR